MEQYFLKRAIKPVLREIRKAALRLFKKDYLSYYDVINLIMYDFQKKYKILRNRNRAYFTAIIQKVAIENGIDLAPFKDRGKARSVLRRREYFRNYRMKRRQEKALLESGTDPEKIKDFEKKEHS